MIRLILLPLVFFTISIVCMGQTFQYSRGWTNGKRSSNSGAVLVSHPFHRDDESLPDFFDLQDNERRLEKCLLQIQHYIRNPLQLRRTVLNPIGGSSSTSGNSNNNNYNNNNMPFVNHHQSTNELFEDLNAGEPSDYLKH